MQANLNIQHLLEIYKKVSSQKVNRENTSIVFSKNVDSRQQEEIMAFWGVQNFQQYNKYLRLPLVVGRAKHKAFSNLKHKVWMKLQSWKERLFSQGGKKVLIKDVAISITT